MRCPQIRHSQRKNHRKPSEVSVRTSRNLSRYLHGNLWFTFGSSLFSCLYRFLPAALTGFFGQNFDAFSPFRISALRDVPAAFMLAVACCKLACSLSLT